MNEIAIKNAKVSTFQNNRYIEQELNIGVKNGKISELSTNDIKAEQIIDARLLTVLPGVIDSQVHFRDPGLTHKEDLESGTRGAALGGVTSIFEMPNTVPATTTLEAFNNKMKRAKECAWVNYAFYVGGSPDNIDQLATLENLEGCPGVKVFMGSSTGTLLVEDDSTLEKIFRSGKKRVILHSEDEYRLRERKHIALESKNVLNHPVWRDELTALNSTKRLLRLAEKTGRPVHVLHVTTAQEMELLAQHKHIATVEILPQHLTLFAPDCYERLGAYAQQNPPIREKSHQEALWRAVNDGTVDIMGSDHAPHTREEKNKEYPQTPSGMPGVQTMVPIMLNHIFEKRTSLKKFIELTCENPRRIFGCLSKGRIEVGLDADFTIVDLNKKNKITNNWIASKSGWTPFDGMTVTGWPVMTIVGGKIVMREGQLESKNCGNKVQFTHS
jgi:dihydroorotase